MTYLYWIWHRLDEIFLQQESKRAEKFAELFVDLRRRIDAAKDELEPNEPTMKQLIEWLKELEGQTKPSQQ